jgi:hypothetical protein
MYKKYGQKLEWKGFRVFSKFKMAAYILVTYTLYVYSDKFKFSMQHL